VLPKEDDEEEEDTRIVPSDIAARLQTAAQYHPQGIALGLGFGAGVRAGEAAALRWQESAASAPGHDTSRQDTHNTKTQHGGNDPVQVDVHTPGLDIADQLHSAFPRDIKEPTKKRDMQMERLEQLI
jgi:hypothetical protein